MQDRIEGIIVELLHEQLGESGPLATALGAETVLLGRHGVVDSIGLVTLIVGIEQALADQFGRAITLADERAFSQRSSPFRTVSSLAEYAAGLLAAGD